MSVYENVRCAVLWSLGYKYSFWERVNGLVDANQKTEEVVELIGLKDRHARLAGVLTYAEQRALEIGVTIAGGAKAILLDEPTSALDTNTEKIIISNIFKKFKNKTIILITHAKENLKFFNKVYEFKNNTLKNYKKK